MLAFMNGKRGSQKLETNGFDTNRSNQNAAGLSRKSFMLPTFGRRGADVSLSGTVWVCV